MKIIEADRLTLRLMNDADFACMLEINSNPKNMEFFPNCPSEAETKKFIKHVIDHQATHKYSLYSVDLRHSGEFIGFVGLNVVGFVIDGFKPIINSHPITEIGWRLNINHWGNGYAPEAANAVINYSFKELNLQQIISFTAIKNIASQRVMHKIGMNHISNFMHPKLEKSSPLCEHVLYEIKESLHRES